MVDTCPINIMQVGFEWSVSTEPIPISDDEGEVAPAPSGSLDGRSLYEATQVDSDADRLLEGPTAEAPQSAELEQAPSIPSAEVDQAPAAPSAEVDQAPPAPSAEVDQAPAAPSAEVEQAPSVLCAEVDQATPTPTSTGALGQKPPNPSIAEVDQAPPNTQVDKASGQKPADLQAPCQPSLPDAKLGEPDDAEFDVLNFKVCDIMLEIRVSNMTAACVYMW